MSSTSFAAASLNRRMRRDIGISVDTALKQVQVIGRAIAEIVSSVGEIQPLSLRQTLDSLGLREVPLPSLALARACRVPDCRCPSPDLGEVRRLVDRPEQVTIGLRLRNTTRARRSFALHVGKIISDSGEAGGPMSLSAAFVDLDPGEIAPISVTIDATQHRRGLDYTGAVRVTSKDCEDMTLSVVVVVQPEVDVAPLVDLHCCCHPAARPLRWYHHYYCDPAPSGDQPPQQSTTQTSPPTPGASQVGG
jgi:hypothetical protein